MSGGWLLRLVAPLARPWVAGLVALVAYLLRASVSKDIGLGRTSAPYLNYLADALLHGQLHLRLIPDNIIDLVHYQDRLYLYWPPFPAVLVLPLVALFGVGVSDVLYTVVLGALVVALLAQLLVVLDRLGLAPLDRERRGILVATCAFGSVILILAPTAGVWHTAQLVGLGCIVLAALAALTRRGPLGYFLVGLALGCATLTRIDLLFNGVWLGFYLLRRDWRSPWRQRLVAAACGVAPVLAAVLLNGWYNAARFGSPFETGLSWQIIPDYVAADLARYGQFDLHYFPKNVYYQLLSYTLLTDERWMGGGFFWMTPVLRGGLYAIWRERREPLTWALVLSCVLIFIPIGLFISTGYLTFGSRYLLDMIVPLLILTAWGIRRWRLDVLLVLLIVSCATYGLGSWLWWLRVHW
jgi:hypothetical protein